MIPLRPTHRGRSEAASGSNKTLDDDEEACHPASSPSPGPASRRSWPRILSVLEATNSSGARAKAIDIQAGQVEADGREGIGSSLQAVAEKDDDDEPEESAVSSAYLVSYFIAGGAAGAASRTVVSPLERLKIIMQVQPRSAASASSKGGKGAYGGVVSGLIKMWQEEGFAGFMRGNGINCLRIVPYSAIQFCTYEIAKEKLKSPEGELGTPQRLLAGAIGGTFSCVGTFPLDLVRARISIASASLYADAKEETTKPSAKLSRAEMRQVIAERQKRVPGIGAMTAKVYREEGGIRGLYRGCVPTAAGVAPYVAINFAAYEALRKHFLDSEGDISTISKLSCGALAGSISQTLTYPLDVLRRRMQVAGMKNSKLGYSDKSAIDAIRNIIRADGFTGLYRGLWPNLLKVAPSIGVSFLVYETVQGYIHPHPKEGHHHKH
ncbi:mitochondrial carrier [Jaminaea rosea]|uniref:Mitochondrial carrier n=1 Tax=Jaminaea rosea TaxID=1569628 RepID=A0A316V2U7_9BASI|nr:mitochondrial carrier [Jaminaea rosea]PWN30503.1 mitochondrial carrier [Jaminaea rosea]